MAAAERKGPGSTAPHQPLRNGEPRNCSDCGYNFLCIDWKHNRLVGAPLGFPVASSMGALRIWSGRQTLVGLLACCIVVQTLIAGLHAAHFIEQQFVANDASICHGGNTAPSLPRSDLADPCCPQGCIAGPAAL